MNFHPRAYGEPRRGMPEDKMMVEVDNDRSSERIKNGIADY